MEVKPFDGSWIGLLRGSGCIECKFEHLGGMQGRLSCIRGWVLRRKEGGERLCGMRENGGMMCN